jgi:hypothetical protein
MAEDLLYSHLSPNTDMPISKVMSRADTGMVLEAFTKTDRLQHELNDADHLVHVTRIHAEEVNALVAAISRIDAALKAKLTPPSV